MATKFASIDFEFFGVTEERLTLVCCSIKSELINRDYWLLDCSDIGTLCRDLQTLNRNDFVLLAHQVMAEASSVLSLGLKPTLYKWIDTFAEFRCLSNHYHPMQYGKHLINGKETMTYPPKPKWEQTEGDKKKSKKIDHTYAQLVYKLLGKKIDTDHKTKMRDIIISGDLDLIEENKEDIMKYCRSDVEYLEPCIKRMAKIYSKLLPKKEFKSLKQEMLWRGETMCRTALVERKGYPINYEATKNFSDSVMNILKDIQSDINDQFPDIHPFHLDKKTLFYTKKEKPIKDWIAKSPYANNWLLTDTRKYSLSLDAFGQHFNYSHDYPRGNFGAQMLRFLKTKQSLNGFTVAKNGKKSKKKFWDYVGSDQRVRAYLNPYGAQSARFQPGATGFIFLKAAWMRALVQPPPGKAIAGTDYKSQEYLLAALMSQDKAMIASYNSGDVYLAFAKMIGMVPKNATKQSHKKERDLCKSTVLGISYNMSKYGLAKELTEKTGEIVSEDEAQVLIDQFHQTYYDYAAWKKELLQRYMVDGYIKLADGWYIWGDNPNPRSVGNVPIQGMGSCILRKAIQVTQDSNLDFITPLHDAGYIEYDSGDFSAIDKFNKCMLEAFYHYFPQNYRELSMVGLDTETWSPDYEVGEIITPAGKKVKTERIHVDERAESEYKKFGKYFEKPDWGYL